MLFQFFKGRFRTGVEQDVPLVGPLAAREREVRTKWFSIIRECLYKDAAEVAAHPYLSDFIPIFRDAPLTVNYNFDDYIEELLDADQAGDTARDIRGYETVWDPSVQYRYDRGVIYHPNGFLPRKAQRNSSSWLVFAEDSFADQMIDAQHGHYSTLLSHLFRYTALFVGMSLDDPTLKHLLRQNARVNPGHVHYYVSYRDSDSPAETLSVRDKAARETNFETYNLVTLFLSSHQIAALARLLSLSDQDFALSVSELEIPTSFTYFLSGPVGSGKTTALAHFKSLTTFDEWIDAKPQLILKAADALTPKEREEVDEWINTQFRRKNFLIARMEHEVCVIDRSLLDPLAFAEDSGRATRAAELRRLYLGKAKRIASGAVLLMCGSPEVMNIRTHQRHKQGSVAYIQKLQDRFRALWGVEQDSREGVLIVDTVDRTINEVVKEISRIIHLEPYVEAPLSSILNGLADSAECHA